MQKLEKLSKKLEQEKAKLQKTEALAKALRIKARQQNLMKIGELLEKAKIDQVAHTILLGAFLEISEKMHEEKLKAFWQTKGDNALKTSTTKTKSAGIPLEVSLKNAPSSSLKAALRQMNFKWNSIRNIWEGLGILEEVQTLVTPEDGIVRKI